MIRYLIIDDEYIAHDIIKGYCDLLPNMKLMKHCYDALEAFEYLNTNTVDLIFLDLNMPKLKGFEFLKILPSPPKVIVTTAYKEHALEGFELNVSDYLLKPFSKERFDKALDKVFQKIGSGKSSDNVNQLKSHILEGKVLDKIVVKSNNNIHVIPLDEVLFIESEDDYVMIHTTKGKHLKHQTMKFYEENLDASKFIRIHRSYIVKISEINKIEKYGKDTYQVVLKNGTDLKVSRSRYQELKTMLGI